MTKNSIEITVLDIGSKQAKMSGSGIELTLDKKYLPKEAKIGDKFFFSLASEEIASKNKTALAKEILNQILKK